MRKQDIPFTIFVCWPRAYYEAGSSVSDQTCYCTVENARLLDTLFDIDSIGSHFSPDPFITTTLHLIGYWFK